LSRAMKKLIKWPLIVAVILLLLFLLLSWFTAESQYRCDRIQSLESAPFPYNYLGLFC